MEVGTPLDAILTSFLEVGNTIIANGISNEKKIINYIIFLCRL